MRLKTFLLVVILVAVVFGGAGYLLGRKANWVKSIATVTATPMADTSNLKTYTNEKYGFSFKYPNNWFANDSGSNGIIAVTPYSQESEGDIMDPIFISYGKDIYGGSIDNYLSRKDNSFKPFLQKDTMNIGGKIAYVVKGVIEPVTRDERIIFFNGNFVRCSSNAENPTGLDTKEVSNIFDQILSTFQFTK